uniref:Uncharacterized protein n=1 Tax=Pseudoalteromonas citrea DSM 8771 TaxID=1117314 RepID=U1JU25_9GAMM
MYVLTEDNKVLEVDRGMLPELFKDIKIKAVIITQPHDIYARSYNELLRWAGTKDYSDTHENIVQSLQDCELESLYS